MRREKMEEKFKIGKRYIVEDAGFNPSLVEIEVLEISKKAIKVKYDDTKINYWYKKENFNFKIFEELPTISTKEITREPEEVSSSIIKLEWQPNPFEYLMTWNQANEYAKSLGDGWRLPTIEELKEAYESIGISNIYGFPPKFYWSSSTLSQNINYVWLIDFYNGHINDFSKLNTYYVRCVREVK